MSKSGKIALAWDNSRKVWNLGSADHPGTAWAWSNDDVTCPNEIEKWSYWDENGQVQDALKTLEFDCSKGPGEFILSAKEVSDFCDVMGQAKLRLSISKLQKLRLCECSKWAKGHAE